MKKFLFLLCFVFVGNSQNCQAQIPARISYQGVLKDAQGQPLQGPVRLLRIRFFDRLLDDGTAHIWAQTFESVEVSSAGIFNVVIGEGGGMITPLDSLKFDQPYWISVEVNGQGELQPRVPLTSSPYSLTAQKALTVQTLSDRVVTSNHLAQSLLSSLLPVGTILASMLPEDQFNQETGGGWVLADGRLAEGSRYAALTGSNTLPDLRGMFLRGMNGAREDGDPDLSRTPGSKQLDENIRITAMNRRHTGHNPSDHPSNMSVPSSGWSSWITTGDGSAHENGLRVFVSGEETRPKNISVYYYIKIN